MLGKDAIDIGVTISAPTVMLNSPALPDYIVIVLFALFGGLVRISRVNDFTDDKRQAWFMLGRAVAFGFTFSWAATQFLLAKYNAPQVQLLSMVSFAIAFVGDDWFHIHKIIFNFVVTNLTKWGNTK